MINLNQTITRFLQTTLMSVLTVILVAGCTGGNNPHKGIVEGGGERSGPTKISMIANFHTSGVPDSTIENILEGKSDTDLTTEVALSRQG
jgi:hypothetical protein